MIIAEISDSKAPSPFANIVPFVYRSQPGARTTASFWTGALGGPDDSSTLNITITGLTENKAINYSSRASFAAVVANEQSFFWDQGAQILYFHMTHTAEPDLSALSYSIGGSFNDTEPVLIDGIYCAPLLRSVPKLSQKADLISYPKISLMSGACIFDNTNNAMSQFRDSKLVGNRLNLFYSPSGQSEYHRADFIKIGSFYIEDFAWSLATFTLVAQDRRKKLQDSLLTSRLPDNTLAPILYGTINVAKCLPRSLPGSTGNVVYQIAEELTTLGTIQIYDDTTKSWVTKSPTATSLSTGQFTLAFADARAGGLTGGGILKCRSVGPANKPTRVHATAGDSPCYVIADLICQFLNIDYSTDFFNISEIVTTAVSAGTIGIIFDKQIVLLDAIAKIQNGSVVGLRFETNTSGQYTIIMDDNDKLASGTIPWIKIKDNLSLPITSNAINLSTSITVQYKKDYNDDIFLSEKSSQSIEDVSFYDYGIRKNTDIETALTNQTDAASRADYQATRQSVLQLTTDLNLHGQEYYSMRIYDIWNIELQPEGDRQYFGTWKCKIMGIEPDFKGLSNKISALLLEEA